MKLRITKCRIAAAIVLAPVLYVLNVGPLTYSVLCFKVPVGVLRTLYDTLNHAVLGSVIQTPRFCGRLYGGPDPAGICRATLRPAAFAAGHQTAKLY